MRRRVLHLWFDAAVRRIKPVKTALRRFQQLGAAVLGIACGEGHIGREGAIHGAHQSDGGSAPGRSKLETPDTKTGGRDKTAFRGVLWCRRKQHIMMSKTLARRLERLEAETLPVGEPKVIQTVYVSPGGKREAGPRIEIPAYSAGGL